MLIRRLRRITAADCSYKPRSGPTSGELCGFRLQSVLVTYKSLTYVWKTYQIKSDIFFSSIILLPGSNKPKQTKRNLFTHWSCFKWKPYLKVNVPFASFISNDTNSHSRVTSDSRLPSPVMTISWLSPVGWILMTFPFVLELIWAHGRNQRLSHPDGSRQIVVSLSLITPLSERSVHRATLQVCILHAFGNVCVWALSKNTWASKRFGLHHTVPEVTGKNVGQK